MAPFSWNTGTGTVARYAVLDQLQWLALISMMRRSLANPPDPRAMPVATLIRPHDKVRTQRDLVIGGYRIARGSIGTVTALHRRPLIEVAFAVEPAVSVTIAGYDLKRAVGA